MSSNNRVDNQATFLVKIGFKIGCKIMLSSFMMGYNKLFMIELNDICIKEPKYYNPEEVIPPKQRPTNLRPPERKIVEYDHHENQHVGPSCNVLDYNRVGGGDSFRKQQ